MIPAPAVAVTSIKNAASSMHLSTRNKYFFPVVLYVLWRSAIFLFQIFLQPLHWSTPDRNAPDIIGRVFNSWAYNWDSVHYLHIAQHGYDTYIYHAFFPLWPIVLRVVLLSGFPPPLAVFLLTTLLGLVIFYLFYRLAEILFGEKKAKYALILFCVFPSTFFLNAGYTEGLYLALALWSFYLIERKKYLLASIFGSLAGVTRFVGISMAPSFMGLNVSVVKKAGYLLMFLTGFVMHMMFLFIKIHDPFAYLTANLAWCKQTLLPFAGFFRSIGNEAMNVLHFNITDATTSILYTLLFFTLLIAGFKKLPKIYRYYSFTALLLPLVTYCTPSMTRHILVVFPVFFIMPLFIKSKVLFFVLAGSLFIIQLLTIAKFTNGFFIG